MRPERLLPGLAAGSVAGVLCVMAQTSFAVLIFAGDLAPYVSRGLGLTLLAAAIMNLVVAFRSSLPGVVANPQDSPAAIVAVSAAAIAGTVPVSSGEEALATVLAAIALTSLVAGVFFLLLGWFRQGGLVRYIPYPVVGGFLAGIGWLLVQGGVAVMAGVPLNLATLAAPALQGPTLLAPEASMAAGGTAVPALLQAEVLTRWLPGAGFALVTLLALRRWTHFLILPGLVLGAIALFYLVVWLSGVPVAALRALPLLTPSAVGTGAGAAGQAGAGGWLLGPFPEGGLWQPLTLDLLRQVHWPSVMAQAGSMATILVVSTVSLLLNASGLELLARRDVDLNRELKAAGAANFLAGLLGGGPVGYQTLSISSLGYRMGAPSRLVSVMTAAICGLMLLLGPSLLAYVPVLVPGGLILFLGLAFLTEWLYDAWFRLSRGDYAIVVLILVVTMAFGILEGVGLGLAVALFLFVLEYSRVGAVRRALSANALRSNVDRSRLQERILREKADSLFALELQGYLFFGTAHGLLQRVGDRLAQRDRPEPGYVLLDFRHVSGMDVSAALSFARMAQLARSRNLALVLTNVSPGLQHKLERELPEGDRPDSHVGPGRAEQVWHVFPDLDHGLEWCEDQILDSAQAAVALPSRTAAAPASEGIAWLEASLRSATLEDPIGSDQQAGIMRQVMAYMERLTFVPGQVLIHQGEPTEGLYFIEEGQVTIRLEREGGDSMRLRTRGPGTVVGEVGLYLGTPATASVVVDGTCTVYRLSPEALARMEVQAPELAAAFHRAMASHLSDRLASTTEIVQSLMA